MSVERKLAQAKSYSIGELSILYGMPVKTINNWLKPHIGKIGRRIGRYYTLKQVLLIFEILEWPEE
jgi:DNA-binding transcriptional MerR regulator